MPVFINNQQEKLTCLFFATVLHGLGAYTGNSTGFLKLWVVKFIDIEEEQIIGIRPGGAHGMRQS